MIELEDQRGLVYVTQQLLFRLTGGAVVGCTACGHCGRNPNPPPGKMVQCTRCGHLMVWTGMVTADLTRQIVDLLAEDGMNAVNQQQQSFKDRYFG